MVFYEVSFVLSASARGCDLRERDSPESNRVSPSRLCARVCFTAEFLVRFALRHCRARAPGAVVQVCLPHVTAEPLG